MKKFFVSIVFVSLFVASCGIIPHKDHYSAKPDKGRMNKAREHIKDPKPVF
jgi:hypothetical protein